MQVAWLAAITAACDHPSSTAPEPSLSASAPRPEYRVQTPRRLEKPIPNLTWLNKNECPLLPAMERELEGVSDIHDCGHLPIGSVNSMWSAAHACVLEAQRAGRAFRSSAALPSYDSVESAGFVSRGRGHKPVFIRRSSHVVASWKLQATLWTCDCERIVAREDCVPSVNDLCLDCEGLSRRDDVCQKLETF